MRNIIKNKKKIIISIIIIIAVIIAIIILSVFKFKKKENNKKVENSVINEDGQFNIEKNIENETLITDINQLENETIEEDSINSEDTSNKIEEIKLTNNMPYYIKINYEAQVVTVYKKDDNNEYTIPTKVILCSTGTFTPKSGTYKIKSRWRWLTLQGNVYGQYCTQITGNILFHSVPYLEKESPNTLEYWEYDKLGTYASAGCIRMNVSDASWIYNNCDRGTSVEFYADSNPGPLGKPSSRKISNEIEELRNWDPTDPDGDNPWKNSNKNNNNSNTNTNIDNIENQNITNNKNINTSENNNTVIENTTNNQSNNSTESGNIITNTTEKEKTVQNNIINKTENTTSIENNTI